MKTFPLRHSRLTCLLLGWLALGLAGVAQAGSLEDFGYGATYSTYFGYTVTNRITNLAHLAPKGERPLVVLVANVEGQPALAHDLAYYSNFVFNASAMPSGRSIRGYFSEVSNGRFTWRLGAAMLVQIPAAMSYTNIANRVGGNRTPGVWSSNVVYTAMSQNPSAFQGLDLDHNSYLTQDEMQFAIFSSDYSVDSITGQIYHTIGLRGCDEVWNPACGLGYSGNMVWWWDRSDFESACHELAHSLGAFDLYGCSGCCYNNHLSLMSCSPLTADNIETEYLDPWHRLLLGWCEPRSRIYSCLDSGSATIPVAQLSDPTAPVILYDPSVGTSEYWMLEYRDPARGGYDADAGWTNQVPNYGLVLWHIIQNADHSVAGPFNNRYVRYVGPDTQVPLGSGQFWGSDATTSLRQEPPLGRAPRAVIHVRPFSPGDSAITVEWAPTATWDVWVAFSGFSGAQLGTADYPYWTLGQGTSAVQTNHTVHIYAGHTSETPTISKPMVLRSVGGTAFIGK